MDLPLIDTDLKFFNVNGRHYVLDIPSSSLFEIHPWIKKILVQSVKNTSTEYLDKVKREHNFLDWMDMSGELNYLIDNRYLTIYSSEIKPYKLKEQKINSLTLNICDDCNMQCNYCYQSKNKTDHDAEYMSKDVAIKSIEFLFSESPDNTIYLNISGGEPLLNPDLVVEIVQIVREYQEKDEKNVFITITTNGTLIEKKILDQLKYYDVELIITLDGRPQEHNYMRVMKNRRPSYDRIYDRLQWVKESGIRYRIKGTIHHYNVQAIGAIFEMYEKAEFPLVQLQPVIASEDSEIALTVEDIQIIKDNYAWMFESFQDEDSFCHKVLNLSSAVNSIATQKNLCYTCGAGKYYLCITPIGDIYPCHLLVGYPDFYLGNIADEFLDQTARKKFYQPLHVLNRDSCKSCWARYFCGGGCVGENFLVHHSLTTPYEPRCEVNQHVLDLGVEVYCSSLQEEDLLSFVPERRKSGREIYKIG